MQIVNKQPVPLYSGKQMASGDVRILSANKSFLLRNRIMDVSMNQRLLQIESNNFMLSAIRFCQQKYRFSTQKQLAPTITESLSLFKLNHRIISWSPST